MPVKPSIQDPKGYYVVHKKKNNILLLACLIVSSCAIFVIGTGVLIGLLIYFLLPRVPTVVPKFNDVSLTSFDIATANLQMTINMTLTVTNPNPYDMSMAMLNVNVYQQPSQSLMGYAQYPQTTTFPSKQTVVQNLILQYTNTDKSQANLYNLAVQCSPSGSKKLSILLKGQFNAYISNIKYAFSQNFDSNADLPCCFGTGC
jgi:hypothetical protein